MIERPVIWRNGELIPAGDATAHITSHMAARGSQVFDVLLVTTTDAGPCAVGLRPHVSRFLRSAELMGMEDTGEVGPIERAVAETAMANVGPDTDSGDDSGGASVVKLIAAWDQPATGVVPASLKPSVYLVSMPYMGSNPGGPMAPRAPIRVKAVAMPKMPASILPPSLKVAAAYTGGVREQIAAEREGFDHIVTRTLDGDLAESTTSSMIVVSGERLLAPPLDTVLDGITRRLVLDVAHHQGLAVEIRPVGWDEVDAADELFLSSTNNPVNPVGLLDDRELDAPGPVTAGLSETVAAVLAGKHDLAETWLTNLAELAAS